MTALTNYLEAVENRKALDGRGGVNVAIVQQLEKKDIPLLIAIIRGVFKGPHRLPLDHEAEIESLAAKGDCSRWGDCPKEAS